MAEAPPDDGRTTDLPIWHRTFVQHQPLSRSPAPAMPVARTERCHVAVHRSSARKVRTRQPVDSSSIEGSISSEMSSTFGS
eukprot:1710899-Prymnesium_polylepis.1